MRELDECSEFLLENFRDIGFGGARPNRHSHGHCAAVERTGNHTDVCATPLAAGHFSDVVDRPSSLIDRDLDIEYFAVPGDAILLVINLLDGVSENRRPFGDIVSFSKNVEKLVIGSKSDSAVRVTVWVDMQCLG